MESKGGKNISSTGDISSRAEIIADWEDFMNKFMIKCDLDAYDEKNNPEGFINLGTGVNNMCLDIILPRLQSNEVWTFNPAMMQYKESHGTMEFREAMAKVMTKFLEPAKVIKPEQLFCAAGVTACIDMLGHCLADPGDVVLTPTPIYGRISTDFLQRAQVKLWHIPVITHDNVETSPKLTIQKVKEAYDSAISQKQNVRAIFLINPSNPLGDIYSPELLMDILNFSKEHQLHVIVDEVYALSVFNDGTKFHSVLQFSKLPDRNRTHMLYGISKDFGIAGLRVGIIHTENEVLQKCLKQIANFHNISFPIMDITATYMENPKWLKEYLSVYKQRLTDKYQYCQKRLTAMGLYVRPSHGGFFLWVDFRSACGIKTFEQENAFFNYLIKEAHLYIVPGMELFCAQPGWFRITFTSFPEHLDAGFERLEKALKEYQH